VVAQGIYSALTAIEIYAQIFDEHNAITKLENFASKFGAEFYKLPHNKDHITLIKNNNLVPNKIEVENQELIPFLAGENLKWQLKVN
jgi:dihydroorotase